MITLIQLGQMSSVSTGLKISRQNGIASHDSVPRETSRSAFLSALLTRFGMTKILLKRAYALVLFMVKNLLAIIFTLKLKIAGKSLISLISAHAVSFIFKLLDNTHSFKIIVQICTFGNMKISLSSHITAELVRSMKWQEDISK